FLFSTKREADKLRYSCKLIKDFFNRLRPILILISALRGISKVRKVGHRTQLFGLRFQLSEPFAHLVNHLLQRGTSEIRELLFSQVFPQMLHWTLARDCKAAEGSSGCSRAP